MRIVVFDDVYSIVHIVAGIVSATVLHKMLILIFLIYVMLETLGYIIKYPNEQFENFMGDIIEFIVGAGMACIALSAIM